MKANTAKILTVIWRLGLIVIALSLPAWADWKRACGSAAANEPQPHPLSYFTKDALLREYDGRVCESCTKEAKAEAFKEIRAEVIPIGDVTGYSIFDVDYYQRDGEAPFARSTIVKTGSDKFREIFYAQVVPFGSVSRSLLIYVSDERHMLWKREDGGGNKHPIDETAFWFDAQGCTSLDMEVLWKVALEVSPKQEGAQVRIWNATAGVKGTELVLQAPVWDYSQHPPPEIGTVSVEFKTDGGRIVVTGKKYVPKK